MTKQRQLFWRAWPHTDAHGLEPRLGRRFFFQAEDGIRVTSVTGVQTCALPIFPEFYDRDAEGLPRRWLARVRRSTSKLTRSEERRVRKECRSRGAPEH